MKNLTVKYDSLKLKKIAKYTEQNEEGDIIKHVAHFHSKDVKVAITKKDAFLGLIVGQEYKFNLSSDQQLLVTEPEADEDDDAEQDCWS